MKRLTLSFLFAALLTTECFPQEANCELQPVVKIDGQADEWPLTWVLEPDDKKFSYNICTDETSIYVRMKTQDSQIKRKIALFGLTLWIDPNGKKKRNKLGMRFPTGFEGKEKIEGMPKVDMSRKSASEKADFQKEVDNKLIADLEVLELLGLAEEPLTSTRSGITNGIKVALAMTEGNNYVYEAIIPFKAFRLSKASMSVLSIGFETGKYVADKKPTSKNVPQGGPGQAGTGPGYGGDQGYYDRSPMSVTSGFWVTMKLK